MPSEQKTTIHHDWELLLRLLKRKKAVLLIGPEVAVSGRQPQLALKETLQAFIRKDLEGQLSQTELDRIEYYSEDGFFFYEDGYKVQVLDSILTFYEDLEVTDVYRKLAQLPFHCILSLSPDNLICKAFDELKLPYTFHHYNKNRYAENEDDAKLDFSPSVDNRLIYNLFGSVDKEDSLIVSYQDLFTFLEKVFNNHKLPKTVRETLQTASCFVFIGFDYGKWYLKLLLRMLNIHDKVRKKYGMDTPARPTVESFFVNEFDMNFTGVGALDFVEELHLQCAEAGLLVTADQVQMVPEKMDADRCTRARALIGEGKLEKAFALLLPTNEEILAPRAFTDAVIQLSGRWKQLKQENTIEGVVHYDDFKLESNRITKALLELLTQNCA